MSAAFRAELATTANLLLGYATKMWQRADKAAKPHDRAYYDRVGSRYFAQSCDLIDYADALAIDPRAVPQSDVARAMSNEHRSQTQSRVHLSRAA